MKLRNILNSFVYLMIGFAACNILMIGFTYWITPQQKNTSSIKTQNELLKEFGEPTYVDTIFLKKDIRLYEFQGGLYKFIPENDSMTVIQNCYKGSCITTEIWYVPLGSDSIRVIDNLSWNHIFIQY